MSFRFQPAHYDSAKASLVIAAKKQKGHPRLPDVCFAFSERRNKTYLFRLCFCRVRKRSKAMKAQPWVLHMHSVETRFVRHILVYAFGDLVSKKFTVFILSIYYLVFDFCILCVKHSRSPAVRGTTKRRPQSSGSHFWLLILSFYGWNPCTIPKPRRYNRYRGDDCSASKRIRIKGGLGWVQSTCKDLVDACGTGKCMICVCLAGLLQIVNPAVSRYAK